MAILIGHRAWKEDSRLSKVDPKNPQPEIWGGSLLGMARGLEGTGVSWADVQALLQTAGIPALGAEHWYPMRQGLAFLQAVEAAHGREAIRAMGRAIPDTSRFPPGLERLERALHLLDVAYQVNHRGGPIGRYLVRQLEPGRAEMLCENPYPCDLDLGILERLEERFHGGEARAGVIHRPGPQCRRLGAKACLFELRW